jgi:hypothetical protein
MIKDNKLLALAQKELPALMENVIVNEGDGYRAFGHYTINRSSDNGYYVECKQNPIGTFSSTKSALAWCIADKYKQINLARSILLLDEEMVAQKNDIDARKQLARISKNSSFTETVNTKISYRIVQYQSVKLELSKCIDQAKYMQIRGFSNEIVRTGRNTPNKANS